MQNKFFLKLFLPAIFLTIIIVTSSGAAAIVRELLSEKKDANGQKTAPDPGLVKGITDSLANRTLAENDSYGNCYAASPNSLVTTPAVCDVQTETKSVCMVEGTNYSDKFYAKTQGDVQVIDASVGSGDISGINPMSVTYPGGTTFAEYDFTFPAPAVSFGTGSIALQRDFASNYLLVGSPGLSDIYTLFARIEHKNNLPTQSSLNTNVSGTSVDVSGVFADVESNLMDITYDISNDDFATIAQTHTISSVSAGSTVNYTFSDLSGGNYKIRAKSVETNVPMQCVGYSNESVGNSGVTTYSPVSFTIASSNVTPNINITSPKSSITNLKPTLIWTATSEDNVSQYRISLDNKIIATVDKTIKQVVVPYALAKDHIWKVEALKNDNSVLAMADAAFTVISPSPAYPITLISPINGTKINSSFTTLVWTLSKDPEDIYYEVYVDKIFAGAADKSSSVFPIKLNQNPSVLGISTSDGFGPVNVGNHLWQIVAYRKGQDKNGNDVVLESGRSVDGKFEVVALSATSTVTPIPTSTTTPLVSPDYQLSLIQKNPSSDSVSLLGSSNVTVPAQYRLSVFDSNGKLQYSRTQDDLVMAIFDQSKVHLSPGSYSAKLELLDGKGNVLAATTENIIIPAPVVTAKSENLNSGQILGVATQTVSAVGIVVMAAILAAPLAMGLTSRDLFLSALLIILGFKKKNPWGLVYHNEEKKPVPFAVVRLLDGDTNAFVKDTVTDTDGRFAFVVDKGRYHIDVRAEGYQPLLQSNKIFSGELYQGEVINAKGDNFTVGFKIPISTLGEKFQIKRPFLNSLKPVLPLLLRIVTLLFFVYSLVISILEPNILNVGLLAIYTIFAIIILYTWYNLMQTYGIVSDGAGGLSGVFVRLLDHKSLEMVHDLVLTDDKGRFPLIADNGDFFLNVEKEGYTPEKINGSDATSPNIPVKLQSRIHVKMKFMKNDL